MLSSRQERLYALFEAIGKKLTMDKFEDRLEVQKIPYLAKSYGINLEYSFSWYLKGPYSKILTRDGFAIHDILKKGEKPIINGGLLNTQKVKEFTDIIKPHMDDPIWLEIAASIIYLRKEQYSKAKLDQIIGYLIEDMTCGYKDFDKEEVWAVLDNLLKTNLLN